MSSWLALLAPAGTPRAVIDHLNAAVNAAVGEPQLRQKIMDLGVVSEGGSPEDLAAFLNSESQKWKRVIEIAAVRIE
jgi:tripartite-type tricarboxylate transporter receptor subunit TctC